MKDIVGRRTSGAAKASGSLPAAQIPGVQGYAEEVRGDEAELARFKPNEADDDAVDRSYNPAVPEFLANEDRGDDRKDARNVIETEHASSV